MNDYEMQHNAEVGLFTKPSSIDKDRKKGYDSASSSQYGVKLD